MGEMSTADSMKMMAALGENEYLKAESKKQQKVIERQHESITLLRGEVLGVLKALKYLEWIRRTGGANETD